MPDEIDKLTGLDEEQKKILRKIRSEQREDPYSNERLNQSHSEEEDLDELTDGELEAVEKKPDSKKAWESWLEQRHLPLWEKIVLKGKKWLVDIPITDQNPFETTKATSAGDGKFGNPHESGGSDDSLSGTIDDAQIYIGKPAKDDKKEDGQNN